MKPCQKCGRPTNNTICENCLEKQTKSTVIYIVSIFLLILVLGTFFIIKHNIDQKELERLNKLAQENQQKLNDKIRKATELEIKKRIEESLTQARERFSSKYFENAYSSYKDVVKLNGKLNNKDSENFVFVTLEQIKKNFNENNFTQAKDNLHLISNIDPNNKLIKEYENKILLEEQKIADQNKENVKNEAYKKIIFYELAELQDKGVTTQDDIDAQYTIAKKYNISRDEVLSIMVEGAKNDWPLPPSP